MLALKPILVFFAVVLGVVFVVCDYILRVDDNYTVTLRLSLIHISEPTRPY